MFPMIETVSVLFGYKFGRKWNVYKCCLINNHFRENTYMRFIQNILSYYVVFIQSGGTSSIRLICVGSGYNNLSSNLIKAVDISQISWGKVWIQLKERKLWVQTCCWHAVGWVPPCYYCLSYEQCFHDQLDKSF